MSEMRRTERGFVIHTGRTSVTVEVENIYPNPDGDTVSIRVETVTSHGGTRWVTAHTSPKGNSILVFDHKHNQLVPRRPEDDA